MKDTEGERLADAFARMKDALIYTMFGAGILLALALVAGADLACHYVKQRVFWEAR
jgi:hypothetical protein